VTWLDAMSHARWLAVVTGRRYTVRRHLLPWAGWQVLPARKH